MAKISEGDLILNKDGSVYHLNLLPKHVSEHIIAVGDPGRVHRISRYFDKVEFEMNKREFITHVGRFNNKRVTVISTGIGTDNVEIFMTELDALVNIDLKTREPKSRKKKLKIIRIGTTGAIQQDIPVGSHLASDYAVGFDNLMSFYNFQMDTFEQQRASEIQQTAGLSFCPYVVRGSESLRKQFAFDMVTGNAVTTPGFYAPQGRILRLPIRNEKLAVILLS
jgi:uridine phosphorylase